MRASVLLGILLLVPPGAAAGAPSDPHRLVLKAGRVDPRGLPTVPAELGAEARALRAGRGPASPVTLVVQADSDAAALRAVLEGAGARVLSYLPEHAWVVRVAAEQVDAVAALPGVRWSGEPRPGWKIGPDVGRRPYRDPEARPSGLLTIDVELAPDADLDAARHDLEGWGMEVLGTTVSGDRPRLRARVAPGREVAVAGHPDVLFLEEAAELSFRNDTATWVVQSDVPSVTPVWQRGIHGEGQIVGHIDGRLDLDSCWFRDPAVPTPGPTHRKVVAYRSSSGPGKDTHGTHTAGTIAGDQAPVSGTTGANGHAWAARLSHTNLSDVTGSGTQPSNLYGTLQAAHGDGARVHANSWGDDGTTAYTTWCVDADDFAHDHEESLVVFAVTNEALLKTPENAKNVLAVGASDNGTSDDLFCSGGEGPTSDGRRKPEIFAPGCGIVSARATVACSTTTQSGTSMAAPAIAGAAALVRQYFVEGWYPSGAKTPANALTPSGALLKATLVNGAADMTGISGYPSDQEGWGRALLDTALHFAGEPRTLRVRDVRNASGLATGQTRDLLLQVTSSSQPLRVTLAWTEPAASLLAAQAWINDLDLEVRAPDGTTYRGNVFSGGISVPAGTPDARNSLEQVILPSPAAGTWLLTVRARSVPQGPQGFALVASGALTDGSGPFLLVDGDTRTDRCRLDAGFDGDGLVEPGESVSLRVRLRNAGTATATNVTGTLSSPPPGVLLADATARYPDIAPGATALPVAGDGSRVDLSESVACGAALPLDHAASSTQGTWGGEVGLSVHASPRVVLWSDDFETDRGWTVVAPNDATAGTWQRGDPQATIAQPEDDHSAPGAICWATGLLNGGSDGAADVDAGSTTLRSPAVNLAAAADPELEYWRWYSNDRGGAPGEDTWTVQVSFNDGGTWTTLESTTDSETAWVRRTFRLRDHGTPTSTVRVRAIAADTINPSLVEAALDDVRFTDPGPCDVCPDESTPPGEVAGLRLAKASGGGFDLSWVEPAAGGRASSYVLYRTPLDSWAPLCDGSLGLATTAHRASLANGGFVVVARNAAGEGSYGPGRAPAPSPCP